MLDQNPLFNIYRSRFFAGAAVAVLAIAGIGIAWRPALWAFVVVGPIILVGIADLTQTHNTIRRNFPVIRNFRFLFLSLG